MSSAFWVGPDSGVKRSADAAGARTSAAASAARTRRIRQGRGRKAGQLYRLGPRELRDALLDERAHALHEVLRTRQRVLELRLEVELAGHVRVEHLVQRLLRARI